MPISSGAEGHVGVGVDPSIKWIPEGCREYERLGNTNSYLQRYLQQHAMDGNIKEEKGADKTAQWNPPGNRSHDQYNGIGNAASKNKNSGTAMHPETANLGPEESTKQSLSKNNTEQSKNKQSNTHNGVHKETHSTTEPVKGASNTLPNQTEAKKNSVASTNGKAKKSSACAIL